MTKHYLSDELSRRWPEAKWLFNKMGKKSVDEAFKCGSINEKEKRILLSYIIRYAICLVDEKKEELFLD